MRAASGTLGVLAVLMLALAGPEFAHAHSASDAYLTLAAEKSGATTVLHGQWDIALRDLDFVLKLDDDGDGRITWGELRRHQAAIARYVYGFLKFDAGDGIACSIKPTRQLVDEHADGSYAALFFDVACSKNPTTFNLRYALFFAIDPSHRGIFVATTGGNVATALFSPENAKISLTP